MKVTIEMWGEVEVPDGADLAGAWLSGRLELLMRGGQYVDVTEIIDFDQYRIEAEGGTDSPAPREQVFLDYDPEADALTGGDYRFRMADYGGCPAPLCEKLLAGPGRFWTSNHLAQFDAYDGAFDWLVSVSTATQGRLVWREGDQTLTAGPGERSLARRLRWVGGEPWYQVGEVLYGVRWESSKNFFGVEEALDWLLRNALGERKK